MEIAVKHCRICGNDNLVPVLDVGEQYLTGVFPRRRDEPVTRGPLRLVKCHREDSATCCGLVQLGDNYPQDEMYGANYGYRSSLNQSMVRHLHEKVDGLLALAAPAAGDLVLDIGSNDGTSLSFYPENLTRVGIDPTSGKFRQYYPAGVQPIEDFFSAATFRSHFGDRKARIVSSVAMFYDLEDPVAFVRDIVEVLDDEGIWHFEQSYLPSMLEENAYDTVCQEHLLYYSFKQVKWMLDRAGLKVVQLSLNKVNGGSFAVSVAKDAASYPVASAEIAAFEARETAMGLDGLEIYARFRERVFEHRDALLALLGRLKSEGKSVLGYGASTKGNVILQFCHLTDNDIGAIAELNPDKYGCFTPGTGIPIISEAQAHAMHPDYFLVLPWHFRDHIMVREATYLAAGGKLIFPLPSIEIIG